MTKVFLAAAMICVLIAASAQAEQGMSKSKLANLGLASFQPVSDEAGTQVRGQGSMFISGAFISVAGPSSSTFNYGAGARGANLVGLGGAQTTAGYSVITSNFFRSYNSTAFGRSLAWAP